MSSPTIDERAGVPQWIAELRLEVVRLRRENVSLYGENEALRNEVTDLRTECGAHEAAVLELLHDLEGGAA